MKIGIDYRLANRSYVEVWLVIVVKLLRGLLELDYGK